MASSATEMRASSAETSVTTAADPQDPKQVRRPSQYYDLAYAYLAVWLTYGLD